MKCVSARSSVSALIEALAPRLLILMVAGWSRAKIFLTLFGVPCVQICFGQDWFVGPKFFNLDYASGLRLLFVEPAARLGAQPQVSSAPALNFLHPVLCVGPLKGPATPPL